MDSGTIISKGTSNGVQVTMVDFCLAVEGCVECAMSGDLFKSTFVALGRLCIIHVGKLDRSRFEEFSILRYLFVVLGNLLFSLGRRVLGG